MSTPDAAGFAAACASAAFAVDGPDLMVSGVPARALAEEYGTPLYVYDAGAIRRAYRALAGALEGFAKVVYSIKANPNPAIAAILVGEGAGVEVASAGEFRLALRAGADPARILAAGPGKTRAELGEMVAGGIGEI
ncbi:MAG TPA: type III PLP-dependent enzyme, partial [Methylomirabilota bacterium]|nr:type III PLP-dependent enzyme [Methylomirabilota bacterium]